jgi:hypothetical protein
VEILRSESATRNFAIHAYCVMPDHFHFLARGTRPNQRPLESRSHHQDEIQPFLSPNNITTSLAEEILRSRPPRRRLPGTRVWYIWLNPVRKGLCTQPNNYPLAGTLTDAIPRLTSSRVPWSPPWKRNTRASKPL